MKVKCIRSDYKHYLIVNKIYDVVESFEHNNKKYYRIINNGIDWHSYSNKLVKPLSEIRNDKINRLLK